MHSIGTEIDQKYEKTKTKIFLGERFLDPLPPSGRAQKPPPPLDIARQERRARSKKDPLRIWRWWRHHAPPEDVRVGRQSRKRRNVS